MGVADDLQGAIGAEGLFMDFVTYVSIISLLM